MRARVCFSREGLIGYSLAVLSTAAAAWVRSGLAPALEDRVPFGFFFIAVLFTAWLAGPGPALLCLLLGIVAAAHFVILPASSLWIDHHADQLALVLYAIAGGVSIWLFHRLARQQQLAEQRAVENERLSAGLQQADRRKDEFLALLAHELRNPLAPLRTGLELLHRGAACPRTQAETLQVMTRQLSQVTRLLDDLLDVARFMKGQLRLQRKVIDLRQAVEIAMESTQPLFAAQSHDSRALVPDHPVWVDGDQVRLVQTIANLLTNAAKYTPRHGRIRLHLDDAAGMAALEVVDNGIGIAPDDHERIFNLFTQVDESRCREYQGLGIGLGLVRQLVEAHGGEIRVTSSGAGRGSRFCVALPLAPAPADADGIPPDQQHVSQFLGPATGQPNRRPQVPVQPATAGAAVSPAAERLPAAAAEGESSEARAAGALPQPSPVTEFASDNVLQPSDETTTASDAAPRVLIVDDNRDSAETLAALLTFEGITTEIAHEGGAALAAARQFDPHVVLLDIGLPGMDGFEVARRLRRMAGGDQRRIIAVSGWGREILGQRMADAGFDSHWLKPVDIDALLRDLACPTGQPELPPCTA